ELLELGPMDLGPGSRDPLEAMYDAIIAGQPRTASMETARRKDGSGLPVEVDWHAQRAEDDWIIVGVLRDVTERTEAESRLQHMAHFDALTGLLNRTLFHERSEEHTSE